MARRLYKYRPINGYTEAIFRDKELRFTAPVDLNDPFESRIEITYGDVGLENVTAIEERLMEMYPDRSPAEVHAAAEAIAADPQSMDRGAHFGPQVVEKVRRESAALSLTEIPDDILMWSHYADSHRGIVIEFAVERCSTLRQMLPVQYSSNVPRFEFFRSSMRRAGLAAFLTKSEHWSYEKEWRLVEVGKSSCNLPFDPAALTAVIFGCCCPRELRERVAEWVAGWPSTVELRESSRIAGSYRIQVSKLAV